MHRQEHSLGKRKSHQHYHYVLPEKREKIVYILLVFSCLFRFTKSEDGSLHFRIKAYMPRSSACILYIGHFVSWLQEEMINYLWRIIDTKDNLKSLLRRMRQELMRI